MLNEDLPLLVAIARMQHPGLAGHRTDDLVNRLRSPASRDVAAVLLGKEDKGMKAKYAAELEAIRRLAGVIGSNDTTSATERRFGSRRTG